MAKRFADTAILKKKWYRSLAPKYKAAWWHLTMDCDVAGVWEIDEDSLEFHVGEAISLQELVDVFGGRVIKIDDNKLFITDFIEFQYKTLSEDCKPHVPVISRLKKLNLWKGYSKGFETLKDKDKEKEKEKDREKEKEKEKENRVSKIQLESIYAQYPKKEGKTAGISKLLTQLKTRQDFEDYQTAQQNYLDHCVAEQKPKQFIKKFSTFVSEWRDWLDPETGTGVSFGTGRQTFAQQKSAGNAELMRKAELGYFDEYEN